MWSSCDYFVRLFAFFLSALECTGFLVFLLLVISLLDNIVGRESVVCHTFSLLFEHFALFRFLRLSVLFTLSYPFFLCHLVFLLLVTSLLDNMVGLQSDVCRTFTSLFEHITLFRFFGCLRCSCCLTHSSCVISSSFSSLLCWTTWSVKSLMFAAPTLCSFSISRSSGFCGCLWCSHCLIHSSCVISSSFFSSLLYWTTWSVKSLMFAAPTLCSFSISRSSGFCGCLWCSRCLIHSSCVISSSFFSSLLYWTTWSVKSLMFATPSPCTFSISRSSSFFSCLWCSCLYFLLFPAGQHGHSEV